mmetsp:Transcript_86623/g.223100  ORF Transcript_86623/g.223100 Transcript_86623/m.223100 type:complete len:294 (+) Transcript_86623:512-1393(+)
MRILSWCITVAQCFSRSAASRASFAFFCSACVMASILFSSASAILSLRISIMSDCSQCARTWFARDAWRSASSCHSLSARLRASFSCICMVRYSFMPCCISFFRSLPPSFWPSKTCMELSPHFATSSSVIAVSCLKACGSLRAYSRRCSLRRFVREKSMVASCLSRLMFARRVSRCCSTSPCVRCTAAWYTSSAASARAAACFSATWAFRTLWSTPNWRVRGSRSFVRRAISSWRFLMILDARCWSWLRCARSAWIAYGCSTPGLAVAARAMASRAGAQLGKAAPRMPPGGVC